MDRLHGPMPEKEAALRERISRPSRASRRINETLDVDAALQAGSTGYAHRLRPGHE